MIDALISLFVGLVVFVGAGGILAGTLYFFDDYIIPYIKTRYDKLPGWVKGWVKKTLSWILFAIVSIGFIIIFYLFGYGIRNL